MDKLYGDSPALVSLCHELRIENERLREFYNAWVGFTEGINTGDDNMKDKILRFYNAKQALSVKEPLHE